MNCPEHTDVPLTEEEGGREYCQRCISEQVDGDAMFRLLTRLAATSRTYHDIEANLAKWVDALEEAEDFIDMVTRGPRG